MGRRSRFGLVDVFFGWGANGRGKLFCASVRGDWPPPSTLLVLEGARHAVGCQAEQAEQGAEEQVVSRPPPSWPAPGDGDHCDDPHSEASADAALLGTRTGS